MSGFIPVRAGKPGCRTGSSREVPAANWWRFSITFFAVEVVFVAPVFCSVGHYMQAKAFFVREFVHLVSGFGLPYRSIGECHSVLPTCGGTLKRGVDMYPRLYPVNSPAGAGRVWTSWEYCCEKLADLEGFEDVLVFFWI